MNAPCRVVIESLMLILITAVRVPAESPSGPRVAGSASHAGSSAIAPGANFAVGAVPGAAAWSRYCFPDVTVYGYGYVPPGAAYDAPPALVHMPPTIVRVPARARIDPEAFGAKRPPPRDTERAEKLMTFGDRLFRGGNLGKAEDRYEQAIRADGRQADLRARMAQVAIARGDYHEAAQRFREAQAAEPGWLAFPRDVQGIWGEPRQFAEMLGKIETHLHSEPDDRDAWLVLGAQLYLSGRVARAADIFLKLTDRPPDATLTAFLRAARVAPFTP